MSNIINKFSVLTSNIWKPCFVTRSISFSFAVNFDASLNLIDRIFFTFNPYIQ